MKEKPAHTVKRRLPSSSVAFNTGGFIALLLAAILVFQASPNVQETTPEHSPLSRTPGSQDLRKPAHPVKSINLKGNSESALAVIASSAGIQTTEVDFSPSDERYDNTGSVVEMDKPELFWHTIVFSAADEGITEADWAAIPPVAEVIDADATEVWNADE